MDHSRVTEVFHRVGEDISDFKEVGGYLGHRDGATVTAHLLPGQRLYMQGEGEAFVPVTDPDVPVRITIERAGEDRRFVNLVADVLQRVRCSEYALALTHTALYEERDGMTTYQAVTRSGAAGGDLRIEGVIDQPWDRPHPGSDQMVDEWYTAHVCLWVY